MDPIEVSVRDALEAIRAAGHGLAQLNDIDQIADAALELALSLTKSSVAFLGVGEEVGNFERVYSRAADASPAIGTEDAERLIRSAGAASHESICAHPLVTGGESVGLIGVARQSRYSDVQRQVLTIFAIQVASALNNARQRRRRQEMVDALVNLRAEMERSERERLLTVARADTATRVERAHELAVQALVAVSVHASSGHDLADFYGHLSESVANLVGAGKVLFWQVSENRELKPLPGGYGVSDRMMHRLFPTTCDPEADDIASRVVFKDLIFRASEQDGLDESARVLGDLGVSSAISVPWRAGDHRLGLVAAYDSTNPEGFSREDAWVLQKAALASGLVWQLKHAEGDLKATVERLQKVDAARQMLLKTVSSAVDNERRRFASQLHDDALQKLTAVALQLQRLADGKVPNPEALGQARSLLVQTEDALRRLLFEVRPPALEDPEGLEDSIRARLAILHSLTGIRPDLELELPEMLSYEVKSTIFRQLAEALTNIEKHSGATEVQVRLKTAEGGIHGVVADNGRGFVVAERNNLPGHLGLLGLRERALMAGGWYKIESQPGLGTMVEFWMPAAQ